MIGILIIGCMLISYVEIASSTSDSNEVGSLSTWSLKFFNLKIAKFIGIFLTYFYLPSAIVILSSLSSQFIIESIRSNGVAINPTNELISVIFLSGIFIIILMLINTIKPKLGEKTQIIGTIIKFIPFTIVVIVGFFMVITGNIKDSGIDSSSPGASKTINGLLLSMPLILFTFDGFIHLSNLQNEMKDKKKFPKAIIISFSIIAITYLMIGIMSV
jgi:amino acid transporter